MNDMCRNKDYRRAVVKQDTAYTEKENSLNEQDEFILVEYNVGDSEKSNGCDLSCTNQQSTACLTIEGLIDLPNFN